MSKKIKWGVIGSGGIARRRTILEGITQADNAEFTLVYDINKEANCTLCPQAWYPGRWIHILHD